MGNGTGRTRVSCKSKNCPFCKKKGHVTTRSKKCLFNNANPGCDPNRPMPVVVAAPAGPEEQAALNGAADVDEMDCMPLTGEDSDVDAELETGEFRDQGTWDGGLDDDAMSVGEL